ncbi:MAG: serine hydrolase [Tannerellaceae bacterium]|nr:serine hydrolase [Tannerellaceae bacterium]MCD8265227.1 serine hydrolase [Tannerellaceae bacterium]
MKKIVYAIGIIFIAGLIWLFLSGNYYVRQALTHWYPAIDQYTIFDNRVVKASSPHPWTFAPDYNMYAIPEEFMPAFDELGTVAYLIVKDSAILFEQYWEGYSEQSHSNSFSMAKSIVSLAVGCAMDEGLIKGTYQPVADFLPEFRGYGGKELTLHHLLTMSAELDFDEGYSSLFSPTTKLYYGNDIVKQALETKEMEQPGVYFDYQSIITQLLAMIVEQATGEKISEYVSRKL